MLALNLPDEDYSCRNVPWALNLISTFLLFFSIFIRHESSVYVVCYINIVQHSCFCFITFHDYPDMLSGNGRIKFVLQFDSNRT